jgi:type IV pilus assembly protein PilQ
VRSGETVVMGGLVTSSETHKTEGVPLLSSLPLIGRLFEHETTDRKTDNLLIFVTATILSERGEYLVPLGQPDGAPAGVPVVP